MEVDGAEKPIFYEIWDFPGKQHFIYNEHVLRSCNYILYNV